MPMLDRWLFTTLAVTRKILDLFFLVKAVSSAALTIHGPIKTEQRSRSERPPPLMMKDVHRYLPEFCPRAYSFNRRPATQNIRDRQQLQGVKFTPSPPILPGAILLPAQSLATAGPNH